MSIGRASPKAISAFCLLAMMLVAMAGDSRAQVARPSPDVPCAIRGKGGETYSSLDQMAPEIAEFLKERFSGSSDMAIGRLIAPRDSEWQVTDVVLAGHELPWRRFIQGGRVGTRWYVWYEAGGLGHFFHLVILDLPEAAPSPRVVIHLETGLEELCPMTRALWNANGDYW